jgi:hypothetical protein
LAAQTEVPMQFRSLLVAAGLALTLGMIALLRLGASPVKIMIGLAAACLILAFGGFA